MIREHLKWMRLNDEVAGWHAKCDREQRKGAQQRTKRTRTRDREKIHPGGQTGDKMTGSHPDAVTWLKTGTIHSLESDLRWRNDNSTRVVFCVSLDSSTRWRYGCEQRGPTHLKRAMKKEIGPFEEKSTMIKSSKTTVTCLFNCTSSRNM